MSPSLYALLFNHLLSFRHSTGPLFLAISRMKLTRPSPSIYIQCESSFRLLSSYLIKYAQYKKKMTRNRCSYFCCCCWSCVEIVPCPCERNVYCLAAFVGWRVNGISFLRAFFVYCYATGFGVVLFSVGRGGGALSISRAQRIIQTQTQRTFILC